MLRLEGYVRVSRVGAREGEGFISPDVQREAIQAYARELGGEIVGWHDDLDYSGGTTERPGFQRALDAVDAGSDGIVVMRVDRFARSTADGLRVIRSLLSDGKVFASCHERIDPKTPEGGFMLRSFLSNAELFLDQAKASWWAAKSRAVARGVHIGPTPVGYRREKSMPLIPDPQLGPLVGELFSRAATKRYGPSDMARWISSRAERPRSWQPSEVSRWLRSRVYRGEVRYGELVNTEAHEPLTDETTWRRAQREPGIQRRAPSPFLLSGLIRCAHCRYAMGGQTGGGHKGTTRVYRCHRQCGGASVITAGRVEGYVMGLAHLAIEGLRVAASTPPDLVALEEELRGAERELEVFAGDLEARRLLGEEGWRSALRERAAAKSQADAALQEAAVGIDVATVRRFEELDEHELRHLLRGLVEHVFVRRGRLPVEERVLVVWAGEDRIIDTPGPHRGGPFSPVDFDS